jgi:LmbE family N-acetylglucosaminyl deacetylase
MKYGEPTERILIVVAHPDDESFFFGGRMLHRPDRMYEVIVVTDGSANDARQLRLSRLYHAARLFRFTVLSFGSQPDTAGHRLDIVSLKRLLSDIPSDQYTEIWTHSPLGDYHAHIHHQDTALACALVFGDRVRYNALGFLKGGDGYRLAGEHHQRKVELLHLCYPTETAELEGDFLMFVGEEMFAISDLEEVVQIYAWQAGAAAADIVAHDDRILDMWRHKHSNHEAAVVNGCIEALGAREVTFARALVLGDSLGLLCESLLSSKIVYEIDAFEPFFKYHQGLVHRGVTSVMFDHLDRYDYDIIIFFEISVSPPISDISKILAQVAASAKYVFSVDFNPDLPAVPWAPGSFISESCLYLPSSCERGAASSFLFRYPETYGHFVHYLRGR